MQTLLFAVSLWKKQSCKSTTALAAWLWTNRWVSLTDVQLLESACMQILNADYVFGLNRNSGSTFEV